MENNVENEVKTFPSLIAGYLGDLYDYIDAPEDKATLDSFSEELKEMAELQASDIGKISEIIGNAVKWLGDVLDKQEDASAKKALNRVVTLLKSMPGYPYQSNPEEKSNSTEEVNKMSEELQKDLEKAQSELANTVTEVEELKNSLIDKDKEIKLAKDDLSTVTEAKNTAEAELATIAQEKKDTELMSYIEREVKLSFTEDGDEAKAERLEALRKLNDEALEVYTGMLSFQEKAAENASATRETVENNNAAPADEDKTKQLKAELEAAFGIKKKD